MGELYYKDEELGPVDHLSGDENTNIFMRKKHNMNKKYVCQKVRIIILNNTSWWNSCICKGEERRLIMEKKEILIFNLAV